MVKSRLNILAEMFSSNHIYKSRFLHDAHRLLVDMGQNQCDTVLLAALIEGNHRIHRCTVNRRNGTHTKNQAFRLLAGFNLVDAVCCTEEQRSRNLINSQFSRNLPANGCLFLSWLLLHLLQLPLRAVPLPTESSFPAFFRFSYFLLFALLLLYFFDIEPASDARLIAHPLHKQQAG